MRKFSKSTHRPLAPAGKFRTFEYQRRTHCRLFGKFGETLFGVCKEPIGGVYSRIFRQVYESARRGRAGWRRVCIPRASLSFLSGLHLRQGLRPNFGKVLAREFTFFTA